MRRTVEKRVRNAIRGAAVATVSASVATLAATHPESVSAPLVDLAALIVVGSSTHPGGEGNENFFQGKFNQAPYVNADGDLVHVNFLTGPAGIDQALQAQSDDDPNAVLASGWGAANTSLLLMYLDARQDPALSSTVFILDNNVSRPDGGFGTRYPIFAALGVNPLPTPTDTSAKRVVDVGYQYDINSNAPAYPLNAAASANSLVAYLYRRLNQDELELPVNADGTPAVSCESNTCGVTENHAVVECPDARCTDVPEGDRVVAYVTTEGNTTYVTYTTDGLPLLQPVRDFVPGGDVIADATEPLLTVAVNAGYPDNNPIPDKPGTYTPAGLVPPPAQLVDAARQVPGAVQQGLTAVANSSTARKPKPLINVVRESNKAVPDAIRPTRARGDRPVATTVKSTIDNLTETVRKVFDGGAADQP